MKELFKNKIFIAALALVLVFAIIGIIFTFRTPEAENTENNQVVTQDFDFTREDTVQEDTETYSNFGVNRLRVVSYGGASDIKTYTERTSEYALTRNPRNTGGLTFAASNDYGEFYFAINQDEQRIIFNEGTSEGKFGYEDVGEVSGTLIRERIPSAEYYAAYPISELALKAGFQQIPDTGAANNFLKDKYLKITNINNNRQVVVEIDTRNHIEDSLMISEATRKALLVDNGILGSFNLQIVDKEENTLGVVQR